MTGRRRIGKTSLVWKAYENEPILYFFVARKAESDLCADYLRYHYTTAGGISKWLEDKHFVDCPSQPLMPSAVRMINCCLRC